MSAPTPTNYSMYSIVGAYGIGLIPHGYYFVKMMTNAKGLATNILYDLPLPLSYFPPPSLSCSSPETSNS
jgi:hypothetical protein